MSDENNNENKKRIELWPGRWVEVDERLANDFDFISDVSKAVREEDLSTMVMCYFALIGGQEVLDEFRQYVINEEGVFSMDRVNEVIRKVNDCLPKVGNRAQRRSWQTSR